MLAKTLEVDKLSKEGDERTKIKAILKEEKRTSMMESIQIKFRI